MRSAMQRCLTAGPTGRACAPAIRTRPDGPAVKQLGRIKNPSYGNPRGAVLLIVLVIVVLLALGAYTFCETMISEREATAMFGRKVETRALADSGIEYVAATLGRKAETPFETYYDRPDLFHGVLMRESQHARGRGRFSIVAPLESDPAARSIRFGLSDESGKLNVNLLVLWQQENFLDEEQSRAILLPLPGMTYEIADAILDWLDEDEVPRKYGAESAYYEKLDPPRRSKNGRLDSLDELLLVRGVTPELLYGEDLNRNGLLDPNEDDGAASPPLDNADGALDRGWAAYLTIYSREANRRADGRRRIDLNQPSLAQLFEEVTAEFGDDVAAFIVEVRRESEDVAVGKPTPAAPNAQGAPSQRPPGKSRISSVYDLIDARVTPTVSTTGAVMKSPWSSEPDKLRRFLPKVLDVLSPRGESFIEGRVNINTASREVLLGIPSMTEQLADMIVARQPTLSTGAPSPTDLANQSTTAWLLTEGLVDLGQMRQLDRYITGRGDVHRIQSVGYFDAGGPVTRLEAVIDATARPPKLVLLRDLTELGRGFDLTSDVASRAAE
jgi:hypothetical protein